ncbi:MAG: hypothetical protein R3F43_22010 [bacterium]
MTRALPLAWLLAAALPACDSGSDADPADDAAVVDTDADGAAPPPADAGTDDAAPPLSLRVVSGDLTYVEGGPTGGHIYSVQVDGRLRQRITTDAAFWSDHAVGPDPRYVAAVRHRDGDGDGNDDADGPGEVWILDVRDRLAWAVSPEGCDAGIGGVGWRDEVRIVYAMSCDGLPSVIYLGSRDDRSRALASLLPLTTHPEPVRDVFPAVATPLMTYVVDAQACSAGGTCITKPQIWVADADIGLRCRLTDGDSRFTDTGTITGPHRRLGDHEPAFNGDLTSVVFSRNVGGKGRGPDGHRDLFRVGLDRRALFGGQETCAQGGTLVNLSEDLFEDAYPSGGQTVTGDERYPRGPAGRAPVGTVLYTGQPVVDGAVTGSALYLVDPNGTRRALTPEGGRASHGTWIVTDYMLDGER